ncbi:amino acid permease-associated region [Pseudarthrobacter chlorophenolicus A6]|uniref:Amino acid permease-associated region n=1 Tax=Pseudarthrobacter chlorophenolicus (strain ATCC 700700 / DSM 12829 / CIP 107037 / JCM 12360 / KCTC 9906 / NCIMB 13794 / A6) TaxID=452863 RepID=B8HE99_PSECP|nr:amino acid permease [Pseudarthrobacter chlorophenolicus]ACL39134.1 amino acid permease-associated region [Pseudarthrobacter chlorophenolicus A6]SDR03825.1 S-methylmethionine transporter [Pseudarthrobacter chlorophenolicus]
MEPSLPTLDTRPDPAQPVTSGLRRSMGPRHLVMIAMGGVIGSGLFLSSGYTISQAGPLGAVIAYLIGAFVVYLVMACLGELAIAYPVSGAFHIYAARSIGPATGFATAWLYWLCWAVAIGSEFTASGLLMQRWFPDVEVWVWCLVFAAILFGFNAVSARFFGESEFWFAIIKVAAIIGLIVLGGAALFGFRPLGGGGEHPFLFENFATESGLFPNGFTGVLVTVLAIFYAFSGSELIGVAAGETKDPATAIPKAMRTTVIRLLIFFVGAIAVIAATIPYTEVGLDESPFVTVFSVIGIPFAADIMNFVIITALLSAGNSGLFSCARMLFSLADEGHAPRALKKLTRRGIPLAALSLSMVGGLASLISSVVAPETVYLVLVSVAGFAVVGVWMSITASHFFHRRAFIRGGGDTSTLAYKAPLFPLVPILAFTLCVVSLIGIALDPAQAPALYFGVPFVAACYLYFHLRHGRTPVQPRR